MATSRVTGALLWPPGTSRSGYLLSPRLSSSSLGPSPNTLPQFPHTTVLPTALSAWCPADPIAARGRAAREAWAGGAGAREGQGVPAGVAGPNPAWVQQAGQELALCHRGRALLPPPYWPTCGFGHAAVCPELHGSVWPCVCCSSACPCVPVSVRPWVCAPICLCVCTSMCLCVCVSLHQCIHASICPCISISVHPCVHVSVHPYVCASLCPCIRVSMHPYTCAPVTPCARVSEHPCVCAPVCPCACIHTSIRLCIHASVCLYPSSEDTLDSAPRAGCDCAGGGGRRWPRPRGRGRLWMSLLSPKPDVSQPRSSVSSWSGDTGTGAVLKEWLPKQKGRK